MLREVSQMDTVEFSWMRSHSHQTQRRAEQRVPGSQGRDGHLKKVKMVHFMGKKRQQIHRDSECEAARTGTDNQSAGGRVCAVPPWWLQNQGQGHPGAWPGGGMGGQREACTRAGRRGTGEQSQWVPRHIGEGTGTGACGLRLHALLPCGTPGPCTRQAPAPAKETRRGPRLWRAGAQPKGQTPSCAEAPPPVWLCLWAAPKEVPRQRPA